MIRVVCVLKFHAFFLIKMEIEKSKRKIVMTLVSGVLCEYMQRFLVHW